MRMLLYLFLAAVCCDSGRAEAPAEAPPTAGILILKAIAGYPAAAVSFVSIQWVNTDGGYVTDGAGTKTPFLNDGIGRIIYFDQAYYEEVDHNQYWLDWRAGLQSREMVLQPVDAVSLRPEDLPRLQAEEATLEDIVQRYGSGQAEVAPLVALLKEDSVNLTNGLVLQNGKWISAKDAAAPESVPVVGDTEHLVTFTTKDGRKFENARITVTDTGLSVLTSDGGASVSFDRLPADLSVFPAGARSEIRAGQGKLQAAPVVAAAPPVATTPTPVVGFWGNVESFFQDVGHRVWSLFASTTPAAPAPVSAPVSSPTPAPAPAPDVAATPAATPAPATAMGSGVVLIKGDTAEGTGFLARTADGPVVITNLHVIASNPNVKIFTSSGEEIVPLSLKGAADRDLAMFAIRDNHYSYLELASDVDHTANVGDAAMIPGNSEGGEVMLQTNGTLVGIGPQRVEFSNPIYHGNSGSPVLDLKNGKVVAVVALAIVMDPSDEVARDSLGNANSAIKGPIRYFGLRLDTVPSWEAYDEGQFIHETLFLKDFDDANRALDMYLTAGKSTLAAMDYEGPPGAKFYQTREKLQNLYDEWHGATSDEGKQSAFQEMIWKLGAISNDGLAAVQNPHDFYSYDQPLAKHELEYRKALITEIQNLQSAANKPVINSTPNMGL